MKKKIVFVLGLLLLLVVFSVALLGYVYAKDTGVALSGRSRLDYNWKYIFARTPKLVENYNGKLFSFSQLVWHDKEPLKTFEKDFGGYMFGDYLTVYWYLKPPAEIKSELLEYLSYPEEKNWQPTRAFAEWLFSQTDKYYIAGIKRIHLKNGVPAALISVKAAKNGLDGNYRYLVTEHNGVIVRIENLAGAEVSNEQYQLLVFTNMEMHTMERQIHPDGERDRGSQNVFERVTETFEFKS
ncbi:MAG: hypothetical protein A2X35_01315 [Elusimicrobia bacterium GWA2_61_42]|nr:MAG: hypothetical protein A2X35_01315 [Elusimicrobia bacterium GWA2_61_42]OGR76307.1 MAG: hypothetical protein A2X38_05180 [Elusimicrobia bacterium GWC2_61_25]